MSTTKQQLKFNERMGKRQRYAHGGRVKRIDHFDEGGRVRKVEHFDDGGAVPGTAVSGPSNATTSTSGVTGGIGGIGNVPSAIQNLAPASAQGPLNSIQSLNPLSQLQAATQNNFQASAVPVQAGTNAAQLNSAYNTAQGGLGAQGSLVNELNNQNGIGNQSQVYNQLEGVANGTGPNPAQAQLAQATGTNVANQGALMAGQRGAAGNVGLIARQAAQQGAATQQSAANQAATLQANQSLNALNSAGSLATSQAGNQIGATTGLNTAAQNEQNILQSANSNLNNANVSQQAGINNVNAQISQGNQSASNGLLGGMLNSGSSLASSISSILAKGGLVGRDGKKVAAITFHSKGMRHHYDDGGSVDFGTDYTPVPMEPAPSVGAVGTSPDEGSALAAPSGKSGGGGGGIGALAALMAGGGEVNYSGNYAAIPSGSSPSISSMGKSPDEGSALQAVNYNQKKPVKTASTMSSAPMGGAVSGSNGSMSPGDGGAGGITGESYASDPNMQYSARGGKIMNGPHGHVASFISAYGKGGPVRAMVSPGERSLDPSDVKKVIEEGANPLKLGKVFQGKAKVKGDSLRNDNIPTTLAEGGVILPRHITNKKDPEKAALFVHRAIHQKRPGK